MTEKELVITVKDGSWFATRAGRHLTLSQTMALIARGEAMTCPRGLRISVSIVLAEVKGE